MRYLTWPFLLLLLFLAGCHQGYSPNTYASNAAQVEANVQRGVIIGVRQVMISASGVVGAAAGGAVGGVAGSQVSGGPVVTALGAIGGTLVGGVGGTAAAQAISNTKGWEYVVQETGDKLVSVTQTSKTSLPEGLHVLVISDSQQARIVPDYTVQTAAAPAEPVVTTNGPTTTEIDLSPFPAPAAVADPLPVTPADAVGGLSPAPAATAVPDTPAPVVPAPPPPAAKAATPSTAAPAEAPQDTPAASPPSPPG